MEKIQLSEIKFEPKIYPREKWTTSTIERYVDALMSGDIFPPIILQKDTNNLIDGKHRLEAHKKWNERYQEWLKLPEDKKGEEQKEWTGPVPDGTIPVEYRTIPEDMTPKYYAALLSAKHGDRLSNADIKTLAVEEFEANAEANDGTVTLDVTEWGKKLGVSKSTVYRYVSHIINRGKATRQAKAWRLSKLGWTQEEIGEKLGVKDRTSVYGMLKNSHLGKIQHDLGPNWNDQGVAETANRLDLPLTDTYAAAMDGMDDLARLDKLGIKIRPYNAHWNFNSCHDLMGDKHPGRIPGELICHVLYLYTKQGDLIVDPMVGSGTTLDACLLMGRKCRGYDIDERHERVDIEKHNLSDGWPETVKKASLVFWDPPYFDKMDSNNVEDGYIDDSVSKMSPDEYLKWINNSFASLYAAVKPGTILTFLMSDWDSENAKRRQGHKGIFIWDYADGLRNAGWQLTRHIQCSLPTQLIHTDIYNKFKASRRMARLDRYLVVAKKVNYL